MLTHADVPAVDRTTPDCFIPIDISVRGTSGLVQNAIFLATRGTLSLDKLEGTSQHLHRHSSRLHTHQLLILLWTPIPTSMPTESPPIIVISFPNLF